MAVADLAYPLEVAGRRREAAPGVLNRLEEDRRHRLGPLVLDLPFDVVRAPQRARAQVGTVVAAVAVGVLHLASSGHERLEGLTSRRDAGDREGAERGPVVGDVAADHLVPGRLAGHLEVLAGELPGRLDRLAAAGGEEHAIEIARGEVGKTVGELDAGRVGVAPLREVGELRGLLGGGFGKLDASVADLDDEEPREPVEVALAVGVVDVGALAALDDGDLAFLVVGPHAREVHPEVPARRGLELVVGHRVPHA